MKKKLLLFSLMLSSIFYGQQTIEKKEIYFPMDNRLVSKSAVFDSVDNDNLMKALGSISFTKASYIEKDLPYASRDHLFIDIDSLAQYIPALKTSKEAFVPSIYENTNRLNLNRKEDLLELTMTKKHGLIVGDVVLVETKDGLQNKVEVKSVPTDYTFGIKDNLPKASSYFVRGKRIDDLVHIEKEDLLLFSIKANQLLYKKNIDLEDKAVLFEEQIKKQDIELAYLYKVLKIRRKKLKV